MAQYGVVVPENNLRDIGISDAAWTRWYLTNALASLPPPPSSIAGYVDSPAPTSSPQPAPSAPQSGPLLSAPPDSTNLGQRVLKRAPTSAATLLADYDQANAARTTRRNRKNFLADAAPMSLLGA